MKKFKNIPDYWKKIELGNICEKAAKVIRKKMPKSKNFIYVDIGSIDNHLNKIISYKTFTWENAPSRAQQIIKQGDVLFSTVRTYLRNIAQVNNFEYDNQICSSGFTVIRGIKEITFSKFLFAMSLYEGFLQPLDALQTGTSYPAVRDNDVFNQKIPLPPLPEQRAIVAKIEQLFSELDNGIANLKTAKNKLEIYRQAVLKKAFEGELTKEWREKQKDLPTADELLEQINIEREAYYSKQLEEWQEKVKEWEECGKGYKKPGKPKINKKFTEVVSDEIQKLTELPEDWTYIRIESVVSKLGDGLHGTPKYSENGEYYFINGNNLKNGKIVFKKNTKKVSRAEYLKYKKELNLKTILVSINGTLGNLAFFNEEKVILGKSACYFNLLTGLSKFYVYWKLFSQDFKNYAFKTATGSTIKNVPLKAMRNYILPLCSLKEQHQIVQEIETRLSVCDNLLTTIEESLEKSEALRQSILKKAFEGKLLSEKELEACRKEPDWEPAEKLLKRIKNEKKTKTSKKKNKS